MCAVVNLLAPAALELTKSERAEALLAQIAEIPISGKAICAGKVV